MPANPSEEIAVVHQFLPNSVFPRASSAAGPSGQVPQPRMPSLPSRVGGVGLSAKANGESLTITASVAEIAFRVISFSSVLRTCPEHRAHILHTSAHMFTLCHAC